MNRLFQYAAIGMMGLFVVWKGVVPAFTGLDTDFPNYYTSSRLLLEGKEISRLYDDDWFQGQITSYGIERQGKFSPFPPVTAFVMVPVAVFPPEQALRVWTVINIVVFAATVIMISKITGKDWLWSSLLMLGSGIALVNNFRFGQWYLMLAFLMITGYYVLEQKRFIGAGIFFGIGAAIKYLPIVLLPVFLARKQWHVAVSLILTIIFIYAVGALVLGPQLYTEYYSTVFQEHLTGNIQNPFSATLQSWNSLLRRLFVYDSSLNPFPVIHSILAFQVIKYLVIACTIGTLVYALNVLNRIRQSDVLGIQIALTILAGMVLLPASATYHFLMLILPVGLFLHKGSPWNIWQRILVGCYLGIGFLPYRFIRDFDGKQWLTFLAYPRLGIVTIMFIVASCYAVRYSRSNFISRPVTV